MTRPLSPEVLLSSERIKRRIAELAKEIAATVPAETELAVLVILKGAFVFAADLVRELPCRTRIGFMEIHKDPERPGRADFVFTHPFPMEGADVLVVEDILDTGHTLDHLLSRLNARRPQRLRTVVLLDKKPRREVPVLPEFIGFEVPDKWVVGYGLDDDENYRNLPFVGFVE
ncbi:MAG: hypoxanthine phosphoribosyltransferase [Acidobacteriota bacterium]